VKVNEIKKVKLEEGFLDNLIASAQAASGGDGITGFIRSLQGQGAAMKKLADSIKNGFGGELRKALGNTYMSVQQGKSPVPFSAIIKLALTAAQNVSKADNTPISADQIIEYMQKNKQSVVQIAGGGMNQLLDVIVQVAQSGEAPEQLPNLKFDQAIDSISLCIASAMVLSEGQDLSNTPFKMDDAVKQSFEQFSSQVTELLLDPTSGLSPDQNYKDNIENLVFVSIAKAIKDKYANLPSAKLEALVQNTPQLVTPGNLKIFLVSHNPSIDPAVVSAMVQKVSEAIQGMFKAFITLAFAEVAKTGRPKASVQLVVDWTIAFDKQSQSLKVGGGAPASTEVGGEKDAATTDTTATTATTAGNTAGGKPGTNSPLPGASPEANKQIFANTQLMEPAAFGTEWKKFTDAGGTLADNPKLLALFKDMIK
jgi:hypothetical protein